VIAVLLVPVMGVMIAGGRLVLGLFGSSYAAAGYGLLIVLAISAVPDAVSNVAVVVCRVTGRLGYSSALNLGILAMTLAGAWFFLPLFGIAGAGVAWLAAQVVGSVACLPVYVATKSSQVLAASRPGGTEARAAETVADAGIALLIEISRRQSLGRLGGRLP
jgi:O-antigen/teichoic acid export membrane protein